MARLGPPISLLSIVAALLLPAFPALAGPVSLKPETLQAWDEYIQMAEARMQQRVNGTEPFLWTDEIPTRKREVCDGKVLVAPVGEHAPLKVPGGLIHDWTGAAFFPRATVAEILTLVQDYDRYKDFYEPLVIESKTLAIEGNDHRFSLLMLDHSLFAKNALATEWKETYSKLDDQRWYSIARSAEVKEIADYGLPTEHTLPPNQGSGYIWRFYSFSRFQQRDEGVYVELEALALSRDIPGALRWFIDPIVRRVSRNALLTSLTKTRAALNRATKAPAP